MGDNQRKKKQSNPKGNTRGVYNWIKLMKKREYYTLQEATYICCELFPSQKTTVTQKRLYPDIYMALKTAVDMGKLKPTNDRTNDMKNTIRAVYEHINDIAKKYGENALANPSQIKSGNKGYGKAVFFVSRKDLIMYVEKNLKVRPEILFPELHIPANGGNTTGEVELPDKTNAPKDSKQGKMDKLHRKANKIVEKMLKKDSKMNVTHLEENSEYLTAARVSGLLPADRPKTITLRNWIRQYKDKLEN